MTTRNVATCLGLLCALACTGCSFGYRVDDEDFINKRYRLAPKQSVLVRDSSGATRAQTSDTAMRGVAYMSGDTMMLDLDSSTALMLVPSTPVLAARPTTIRLMRTSFDADVITIPLRFRFARGPVSGVMPESTNLALYTGFRLDHYTMTFRRYNEGSSRETRRVGIGAGLFAGLTPVAVADEFDLPALMLGGGVMFDASGVCFGLAFGVDHLLHTRHDAWQFEGALWTGVWLGLNLN